MSWYFLSFSVRIFSAPSFWFSIRTHKCILINICTLKILCVSCHLPFLSVIDPKILILSVTTVYIFMYSHTLFLWKTSELTRAVRPQIHAYFSPGWATGSDVHNTKFSTHLAIIWILFSGDSAAPRACEILIESCPVSGLNFSPESPQFLPSWANDLCLFCSVLYRWSLPSPTPPSPSVSPKPSCTLSAV